MARKPERDVEKVYARARIVAKLRRLADAIEAGRPFVIQVAGERFTVPAGAALSVEHERGEDGHEELEFQLTWSREEPATPPSRARPSRTARSA